MNNVVKVVGKTGLVALLVCVSTLIPSALASGRCISAQVPGPFMLPGGSVHPAGLLTLCGERDLTPTTGRDRILVAGMPIEVASGLLGKAEGSDLDDPVVLFVRRADGTLRLAGYASPEGSVVRTHLLSGSQAGLVTALSAVQTDSDREWVLVAARGR